MQDMLQGIDQHYKTGFHQKPLIIAWLPLVNFAVLFASIKWNKYTFYCHVLLSLGVIILTLLSTIHILVDDWLSPNQNFKIQKVHNIAGLAVTIWLAFQIISGVLAKVVQFSPYVKTNTCILIKRIHHISSYLIMLISKFNYLNIKFMKGKYLQFFQYFAIELLFLALYLWIKSSYWTLSEEIVDTQLIKPTTKQRKNFLILFLVRLKQIAKNIKAEVMQKSFALPKIKRKLETINSENEIQIANYILFNDVVYDISEMKSKHPGGQQVINLMNKREVNRFLYGYYRPENDSQTITHTHTKESLKLCGQPIAKIIRKAPMKGFDDLGKFTLMDFTTISPQSSIHVVYLRPKVDVSTDWVHLTYEGHKNESQIGQHLSLTICNKSGRKRCTRLYTSVWCMRPLNIDFMTRVFPGSTKLALSQRTVKKTQLKDDQFTLNESLIESDTASSELSFDRKGQTLPLVIKKYNNGKLTERLLVKEYSGQIIISTPMGSGINYQQLRQFGKVIIICGGTGILPFCDLIDLLFKRIKYIQYPNLLDQVVSKDEVIKKDLIKKRQFILYYAVQSSNDILPITFYQLNALCSCPTLINFKVVVKIKRDSSQIKCQYPNFTHHSQSFNSEIQRHLSEQKQTISKIYVCGPYRMNEEMYRIFQNNELEEEFYQFM